MEPKPLNAACALIFGLTGTLAAGTALAQQSLTGSLTVSGSPPTTQSSAGPNFDLTTSQNFYTNLGTPYNGTIVGNLDQGIISSQAVTGGFEGSPGDGTAITTYTTTITNTSSAAQAFTFNYYIGSGTLIAMPLFNNGGGSVQSSIGASIVLNGTTEWSYSASLTGTAQSAYNGISFDLSAGTNGPSYSTQLIQDNFGETVTFNPYQGSLGLGTLAPGQSDVLTYTLSGTTATTFGTNSGGLAFYGGGLAQIGDPFSVQGTGLKTFQVTSGGLVSAVPEPSMSVMALGGVALLAGLSARRRRLQTA